MSSSSSAIDAHAHVWLSEVESLAKTRPEYADYLALELLRAGCESAAVSAGSVEARGARLVDPGARLAAMDASGVDVQVVSVAPTQYHSWADGARARDLAQATNESVARHCAASPARLTGFGVAPIRHPALAVESIDHAMRLGLRGVEISSHAVDPAGGRTVDLSDRRLDAFWSRAEELGAVVFLHPWGCTLDARLDRWYLSNSVGQPVEHAVALSHLIFSGVLDRFARLRVLVGHGGGYLPAHIGRADFAWRNRPDARGCAEPPSAYLRRMWFDSLVYTPAALRTLVTAVGAERVVLGSDYPFDMGVEDPTERLEQAGLDPAVTAAIRGRNAAALGLAPAVAEPGSARPDRSVL
ncbi:amidohydrolase family protein [Amycolatopsis circi]|uniref:amidohydrolase family protein n=1 Tax=Amycolatopsis circi TaxID=871959 RepID=UPI000E280A1D|nr:amidohydrolase family protein [Amycolatopsis circi]